MRGTILAAVMFAAALGGCYTTGSVGYRSGYYASGGADVYVSTPELVTVSPGVQVVYDYDEPVFFTDGFYWRFYDGYWYRSSNYATGWVYYERPPVAVLRIDRPYAYAHYRPAGYVARNRGRYQPAETIVRDHRQPAYRPEPVVREPVYRQDTVVRDHRDPAIRGEVRGEGTYRAEPPTARPGAPAPAPAPAPVVRDHREPPPAAKKDEKTTRDHRH